MTTQAQETAVQFGELSIKFPYVPYQCQRDFMEKVVGALEKSENAALESPTGTGKTLSLLCSTIAWVQRQKERLKVTKKSVESDPGIFYPKIFFASRTHSQLQQVVRELNKTSYRSEISVAIVAGRDHLCLNQAVLQEPEPNRQLRGHMCRNLVANGKCEFKNTLDADGERANKMYEEAAQGRAMDIEDLVGAARKFNHCPFYRARNHSEWADLVLLPYNYLLDPQLRDMYNIRLKGHIVIFDEAHNMEAIAEESVSVDLSTHNLSVAIHEAKQVHGMVVEEEDQLEMEKEKRRKSNNDDSQSGETEEKQLLKDEEMESLLAKLHALEEKLDSLDLEKHGIIIPKLPGRLFPGQKMVELLKEAQIEREKRNQISSTIDRVGLFLAKQADQNHGVWPIRGSALAEFSTFVSTVLMDTHGLYAKDPAIIGNFQLFIEKSEAAADQLIFHYWCFNAGVAMQLLQLQGTRSILLASGTLAPLNTFMSSMGIKFGAVLESGHCAREEQLLVGTLQKGPNNSDLLGTYEKRDDPVYKKSIGELILQVARVTPQGMLVFFPSYVQMNGFIEYWKSHRCPLWPLLEQQKRLFIEPRDKNILSFFRDFDKAVGDKLGGGALLFAVCRGKLSEGIDFADSHCRAVIVVGIPFAPLYEPRVLLKKAHLTRQKKHPNVWYETTAIRAVNQALGRIIRHKDDFGAVILADSRYANYAMSNPKMFPSWMRPSIKVYQGPATLFPTIQRFFAERANLVEHSRQQQLQKWQFEEEEKCRKRAPLTKLEEIELDDVKKPKVLEMSTNADEDDDDGIEVLAVNGIPVRPIKIKQEEDEVKENRRFSCTPMELEQLKAAQQHGKKAAPKMRFSASYFSERSAE